MILPGMGIEGQQKLSNAKVLVIGAGGLGCPVLQYLAAAGTGKLGIVDDDLVSLSNLHRQVLYSVADIGKSKATSAASKLEALNPDIEIIPYPFRLTNQNALDTISGYDIVVDGSDNFGTRYMVNDACVILGKPLVYGAISKFEGQMTVFNMPGKDGQSGVNYRDLFPVPPGEMEVPNCEDAGVLGVLPGIIGASMANEVLKIIIGFGVVSTGKLLTFNALTNSTYEFILGDHSDDYIVPGNVDAFMQANYDWNCALPGAGEIAGKDFFKMLQNPGVMVIDVRNRGELPIVSRFKHVNIPLDELADRATEFTHAETLIFFCKSGQRSRQAAGLINEKFRDGKLIYSLRGGLNGLDQQL
ncbi:HesA/MoeB/ThiF family protein [Segetibacter sp. 3557_3]|uniref:HesA/MoeB/ThiF family protein n=1 Tax=Segetibacter sp. 3557_3 TaxID=2547429 RepID=UPI001FB5AECE|nr:HesA/MoeB/ThiF family protein [Segetibacter sp. 3557_3]